AEASYVARVLDSDRAQLTTALRGAADHKGAALVEILQNCPIYNDDAYEPLKSPQTRDERLVRLEHGQPIRFGADAEKGVRRDPHTGALGVCGGDDPDVLVHDAHTVDPSRAFALSRLDDQAFSHTPIGIFRDVTRPAYDDMLRAQIDDAITRHGEGDLADLLASGDTWHVG
ncbi:MAG: 2-oxoacid:ferredoxin oxidoreductase subunit beta, partial [Streptosporangiaceae bacterium]